MPRPPDPAPTSTHAQAATPAQAAAQVHAAAGTPVVTRLTRFAQCAALEADWRALADEAAPLNPYASPDWTLTWLRHVVHESELAILTVHRDSRLVGIAPFYLRDIAHLARTAQLAGTGRLGALTELPQVLAAPGETRRVMRAVVEHWLTHSQEWDWLELPLTADQGWFEPQWLGESRTASGLVQHTTTRAATVLPLAGQKTLRPLLKRNAWESVKRARHRLDRAGEPWDIVIHADPGDVRATLPELRRLHAARAETEGSRAHLDALGEPRRRAFFNDAVHRMAASGRVELLTLNVAGAPIAAQLVLRAPSAAYFALSGTDPQWRSAGPVTLLQYTAMERALERGDTEVNLSVGPDIAKLRWSEHVVQHPEFVVCGARGRSRVLLAGYAAAAAVAAVRREAGRHQMREHHDGGHEYEHGDVHGDGHRHGDEAAPSERENP